MIKRGRGYACIYFGMGNTAKPNPSCAYVEMAEDGSVLVRSGAADLGQGSDMVMVQIAAETLGLEPARVSIMSADTLNTPESGISSASRQTYVSGNAVRLAAEQVKEILFKEAAELLESSLDDLVLKNGQVYVVGSPDAGLSLQKICASLRSRGELVSGQGYFNPPTPQMLDPETGAGIPYGAYHYATQMVEVEVDDETGQFEVLRVVAAHDVGRAVNPMALEGQIDGGVIMGLGYAAMENLVIEEGFIKNQSFGSYLLPTTMDAVPVEAILVEEPEPTGPFGAKGAGEPPACPTAAALISAIRDAVDVDITSLPVTAEKVYQALKKQNRPAFSGPN